MSLVTKTYTGLKLQPYLDEDSAVVEAMVFGVSLTIAKGTVVGIKTSDGKWYAYDDALSNGLEVARGIAQYDFTTDSNGDVTIGGDSGATHKTAPVYLKGFFATSELTGLDANGVADLGRLVSGTTSTGVLDVQ